MEGSKGEKTGGNNRRGRKALSYITSVDDDDLYLSTTTENKLTDGTSMIHNMASGHHSTNI